MKKAIVMTLCAAMAVGMIGSVSTVYAADADIASDDAIKKAADEGWEIAVVPKDSTLRSSEIYVVEPEYKCD